MKTILDEIFEAKRRRVTEAKQAVNLADLAESARDLRAKAQHRKFRSALESPDTLNIIAEFKKSSPSKGVINDAHDPGNIARIYEEGGACAISVLTEEDFFRGSLADLQKVREAVSLPVLRKDFIFDAFQIYESANAGADAVLLIVAAIEIHKLRELHRLADEELGMDVLVEVHTLDEMQIAAKLGAGLIGVNNRDLRTFNVTLDVSRELVKYAPSDAILVSESGLRTREELIELKGLGYSGFLIGETLMRSDDPASELKRFTTNASSSRSL